MNVSSNANRQLVLNFNHSSSWCSIIELEALWMNSIVRVCTDRKPLQGEIWRSSDTTGAPPKAMQVVNYCMFGHPFRLSRVASSRQKPITRLLWFSLLDSIAVAGTRVSAAINCGFLFCLFSISVLYWALLLWFPLCGNKPGQREGEEKTEGFCAQLYSMQTTFKTWTKTYCKLTFRRKWNQMQTPRSHR